MQTEMKAQITAASCKNSSDSGSAIRNTPWQRKCRSGPMCQSAPPTASRMEMAPMPGVDAGYGGVPKLIRVNLAASPG